MFVPTLVALDIEFPWSSPLPPDELLELELLEEELLLEEPLASQTSTLAAQP